MPSLKVFLLGPPRIELDGKPVKLETRKTIALLALLEMTGESYHRDSLVNLLWPEYDMTHGRGVLRRTLSALNTALPQGWVQADREMIGLNPAADVWLDVREFHQLLAACQQHSHRREEICPDCQPLLSEAAAIYHADFMSGFSLPDSFNFDDWQFFQTEGLRQELSATLGKLVRCLVLREDFSGAIEQARRRLALDRLNEEAHRDLMLLYTWSGQRTAALRQFQECKEVLKSQLGVDPQKTNQDLMLEIETGRVPAAPSASGWRIKAGETAPPGKQNDRNANPPPSAPIHAAGGGTMQGPVADSPRPVVEEKRILTILAYEIYSSSDPAIFSHHADELLEESSSLIERFLSLVQPILIPYGGVIQRQSGGNVLVIFGLGHSHENDPELALRAALEIDSAGQPAGLCLTAGVATGEAYIKWEKSGAAETYHLAGAVLDQALHLASHAPSGLILAGESTYQLTRRFFGFTLHSVQTLRVGPPVTAYQVNCRLQVVRKTRGSESRRSILVGRAQELAELCSSVTELRAGQGQLVALIGEAGVGKSRLVEELHETIQAATPTAEPLLVLEGRCLELGMQVSYWPFQDMLRQYFVWSEAVAHQDRRVADALQSLITANYLPASRGPEIVSLLSRLLSLQPEQEPATAQASQAPEEIRQQTFLAMRDFLLALARRQPLLLVFEDLHWADPLSLDLITFLLETLPQSRILLLCVFRPGSEYRTAHLAAIAERKCPGYYSEIRLRELSRSQSYQMMDSLLGYSSLAGRVKELIWERCQGNPFFIEEILQSLIDGGMIVQENEHWKTSPSFDTAQLPASIQSIILSRLDHLDEDWKLVLQTAAVIGRVFRRRILAHVLRSDVDLNKSLWELEGRGLIYQERALPEEEFSFRHVLMQEVIYHNIVRHRRKALHQHTAEAIEALYPRSLEDQAEQLAYHYEKSGNIRQTITYLFQAGSKARANDSNEAAITSLTKGLELLRSLPETLERNRQELDFLISLGVPLVHSRGHANADVLITYEQARDLSLKTSDSAQLFMALLGLRRYFFTCGKIQTAQDISRQLVDLALTHQNLSEQARALMMLSEVLCRAGEFGEVVVMSKKGIELCQNQNRRAHVLQYGNDTLVGCQAFYTLGLWHQGRPGLAREEAHRQLAMSEILGHPFTQAFTLHFSANLYIFLREPQIVQRHVEQLLRVANEHGFALFQAWGAAQLGWAMAAQGQVSRGIDLMQRGIEETRKINIGITLGTYFFYLAETYLKIGQSSEALQTVHEGLAHIHHSGELEFEAELYRLKGEILRQEHHLAAAEEYFTRAIATARRQSSRAWELRAATSLAGLWSTMGKTTAARELLALVYAGYQEGFKTPDLLDAQALMADLGKK